MASSSHLRGPPRFGGNCDNDNDGEATSSSVVIRRELRRLQSDLHDLHEGDTSMALILAKVRELTECENRIVEDQRREIERLEDELRAIRCDGQPSGVVDKDDGIKVGVDRISEALGSVPSFDSITVDSTHSFSSGSTVGGHTNESERDTSYSLHTNQHLATRALLSQSIALSSSGLRALNANEGEIRNEVDALEERRARIADELRELEDDSRVLERERNRLIQEVEVYSHQGELAVMLEACRTENDALRADLITTRDENARLREETRRDSETIARLEDEVRTLTDEDERRRKNKRTVNRVDGGDVVLDPIDGGDFGVGSRERSYTGGSDTVSALHEADYVSLLFNNGGESTKDANDDSIRAHAEKVLYWANRASERSKGGEEGTRSSASFASAASKQSHTALKDAPAKPSPAPPMSSSTIPMTIGLPPRSQSRVRKSSKLPPRCPSAPSVGIPTSSSSSSSSSTATMTTMSSPSSPSSSCEKANGGGFASGTKNVCASNDSDRIIRDLEHEEGEEGEDGDEKTGEESPLLCCECTASPFSGNDPQSEFYLPKLGLACACGGGSAADDRANFSRDPTALSNVLRPWQCDFLSTLGVRTADGLLRAHRSDANGMARKLRHWRAANASTASMTGGDEMRTRECYMALKIWSKTCKVVLRSIREQRERARREVEEEGANFDEGRVIIEKPHFLDMSFADTHTITSISTLGQLSSVCGAGRPFEMMEI
ncbi:hypothetical protein ACHAW5_005245 [Stephanodiscus triporus]|uniref:Uncharacterized protein n=1 Tax=Stephanodiscus triporus TaxID=2934178 RepID=A0ABD3N290_9STRA